MTYYSESDIRHTFPKGRAKRGLRVVEKQRRYASPREGERQAWTEWQVLDGRKVLSRHDTERQAITASARIGYKPD